jgi:hypothetical protein
VPTVQSNSNGQVVPTWLSNNRLELRIFTPDGQGHTNIRLKVTDGLVSRLSNTFSVRWIDFKPPDPPPEPCRAPCSAQGLATARTSLGKNSPNPFNPETLIPFSVRRAQRVSLRIFDIQGKLVRNMFEGVQQPGVYHQRWNGKDDEGLSQPSGVYFVRMVAEDGRFTQKMLLLK